MKKRVIKIALTWNKKRLFELKWIENTASSGVKIERKYWSWMTACKRIFLCDVSACVERTGRACKVMYAERKRLQGQVGVSWETDGFFPDDKREEKKRSMQLFCETPRAKLRLLPRRDSDASTNVSARKKVAATKHARDFAVKTVDTCLRCRPAVRTVN